MNDKMFSIIIPVFNAEKTIERALASLISNRDYIKEVIIVNDRSSDNTFEKVKSFEKFFPIKVIDNEGNRGPGPARKTGMLHAKGEWITFLDADDCIIPTSLYYVGKEISVLKGLTLLHAKTIYYENGDCELERVDYLDGSCGGNFYNREYMITHGLFPHDSLYMGEDEYFNEITEYYIKHYDGNELAIAWMDYPVYEVHHDNNLVSSFAGSSFCDYIIKYHLEYGCNFLKWVKEHEEEVPEDCIERFIKATFIFSYFALESLDASDLLKMNRQEYIPCFKEALDLLEEISDKTSADVVDTFYNEDMNDVIASVIASNGLSDFDRWDKLDFKSFVESIRCLT